MAVSTICTTDFLLRYIMLMASSHLKTIYIAGIVVRNLNGVTQYVEHNSYDADIFSIIFLIFGFSCSGHARLSII